MLILEARRQGVRQIVVTHAMIAPIHMQTEQMRQAASFGAWIEFVYNGLIGPYKEFEFADYAQFAQWELTSASSQAIWDSRRTRLIRMASFQFFNGLQKEGFTSAEIDLMSKRNPALILGLD